MYNFFHDFDNENNVLYEFENTKCIQFYMYNILHSYIFKEKSPKSTINTYIYVYMNMFIHFS